MTISLLAGFVFVTCVGIGRAQDSDATTQTQQLKAEPAVDSDKRLTLSVDDLRLDCVLIKGGTFRMGRDGGYLPSGEISIKSLIMAIGPGGTGDEGPERDITITRSYYMSTTKVYTALYCRFLNEVQDSGGYVSLNAFSNIRLVDGKYLPSPTTEREPVCTATWDGANAFCAWLSARTGMTARLPTEAEWEFAARGVEGRRYPWGDELEVVHYGYLINESDTRNFDDVGSNPKNATPDGIMDMLGPVREWCSDNYAKKYNARQVIDPTGPVEPEGPYRSKVMRADATRATDRARAAFDGVPLDSGTFGLRIIIEMPAQPETSAESK